MRNTVGDAEVQGMKGWFGNWSGDRQLWWQAQRVEAHCENEFQSPKAGKFHLVARFTQAPDYGIVQISINGTKVGSPVNLYGPKVAPTQPVDLGTVDLKEGANILGMDVAGTEKGGCYVGLDYIKLVPGP